MTLTAAQIRCMVALLALDGVDRNIASKDVAKLLGVSRPSVHKALDILCRNGVTEKEPYGAVRFTPSGRAIAKAVEARRESLILVFARTFGLSMGESSLAATLLMSELQEESLQCLERFQERQPASEEI